MRDIHDANIGESLCSSLNYLSSCLEGQGLTDEIKETLTATIQYVNKSKNVEVDEIVEMLYKLDDGEVKDTVLTLEKQIEKKGFDEGERNKSIEIARNMKLDGMDTYRIAKMTGLTPSEIEAI